MAFQHTEFALGAGNDNLPHRFRADEASRGDEFKVEHGVSSKVPSRKQEG
ncbi:hypothetical protein GCM10019060_23840 [Novosphingobium pokkalii]|nr:hypothetical protein GCM10019060_23840 [Novosphingobium pokkalii]